MNKEYIATIAATKLRDFIGECNHDDLIAMVESQDNNNGIFRVFKNIIKSSLEE